MLRALQDLSRRAQGATPSTALADQEKAEVPLPSEAHIYKSLLIDLQYNQLELSREYQALFNEKETEIRALRKRLGEPAPEPRAPSSTLASTLESNSLVLEEDGAEGSPNRRSSLTGKSTREPTADELRLVLREWERKMKANILSKTEAVAEAKIQRETVDALDKQLEQLRAHVRKQDDAIKRMGTINNSAAGDATAMSKLAEELAKTAIECDDYKTKVLDLTGEIKSLREKSESDSKAIEVLSAAISNSAHSELTERSQQAAKDALHEQQLTELREAYAALQQNYVSAQAMLSGVETQASASRGELSDKLKQAVADLAIAQERVAKLTSDLESTESKLQDSALQLQQASEKSMEVAAAQSALALASKELEEHKDEVTKLSSTLAERTSELETLKSELASERSSSVGIREERSKAEASLEAKHAELSEQIQKLEAELRTAREGQTAALEKETALVQELESATTKASTLQSELDAAKSQSSSEMEARTAALQTELEALRSSSAAEIEGRTQELLQEVSELKAASAAAALAAAAELAALKLASDALQQSLSAAENESKAAAQELEALKAEKERIESESASSITKARDLEAEAATLKAQAATLEERLQASDAKVSELETELAAKAEALSAAKELEAKSIEQLGEVQAQLAQEQALLESEKTKSTEIAAFLVSEKAQRAEDVARLNEEKSALQEDIERMKADVDARVSRELEVAREAHEAEKAAALAAQEAEHVLILEKSKAETEEFKKLYAAETARRRAVHDELMDLKGNIRVFVRSRPLLASEQKLDASQKANVLEFPPEGGGRDIVVRREAEGRTRFEFDAALDGSSSQEKVFEEVAPMIVSVMDGFNVCLFAYGQTGSGKTYTMQGDVKNNPGVNGRALRKVFEIAKQRAAEVAFTFTVSVLEVYNEAVRDLLRPMGEPAEDLDVRMLPDNKGIVVPGLTKVPVSSVEEVEELMEKAGKNRATGAHNMNEHSSRSHLVFTLTAKGKRLFSAPGEANNFEGNLNLVDLAGSERLSKTDATGDRLKEAQAINKSLSALGDVIHALGEKSAKGSAREHIPYRNSKLTYLLSDQLGGLSKVGFFANCSPVEWNAGETLCTLRFADRCRRTELGKASKNVLSGGSDEVARLKRTVDELRASNSGTPLKVNSSSFSTPARGNSATDAPSSAVKTHGER